MDIVRPVPLGEQIASVLRRDIIIGSMGTDTAIREEILAERFSVSRGPIREALKQLETERLVERSGRSYTVIGITDSDIDEIYAVRRALESLAWSEASSNPGIELSSARDALRRMRDAGIAVFDLGPMEGLSTLSGNITTMSLLLGFPERGQALYQRVQERLASLARGGQRSWRALYIGIHGDKMYGGTVGSSLHDVIVSAGLVDAAAGPAAPGGPDRAPARHLLGGIGPPGAGPRDGHRV